MSIAARWRSWLRRAAVRPPAPCPRPAVEELERREVLSGFAALPDPETGAGPGAEGHTGFIAAAGGPARGFEQAPLDAAPAGALSFGRFERPALSEDTPSFEDAGGGFRRVVPNATVIDAAWLAQRGPGPYLLDQAGATYVLQTDVRTEGTGFVVAAPDVTLDLNGHTVLYGDRPLPGLRNGGFEEGEGRQAAGWGLRDAPAASLAPNTNHLFGRQVLRLSDFRSRQRIVSEPVAIPQAGRTYTATVTPSGVDARSTVRLSVLDAVTGEVLAAATSDRAARGFSAVAQFTPPTTHRVRLQIDVTPPAGVKDSIDLDAATLTASHDYGILASASWHDGVPGLVNLPPEAQSAYQNAANFTLRNGTVRQGQGDGYASAPLFFRNLRGLTVDGVQTIASGMDTESLDATYAAGAVVVRHSTFREASRNVSNRMDNFGTLKLNQVGGPVVVEGNRILGSPQAGIVVARNDPRHTVRIAGNEIRQDGAVTNAYAIILSGAQNFEIAGNVVKPTSGRGILLDGYRETELAHGSVVGNLVEVQEVANREYPTGLESVALRLRNNVGHMGAHRALQIRGNVFAARTGEGLVEQAYGVRVSYANARGQMTDAGIALEDNVIKAVVLTADGDYRAKALVLDRVDPGINLRIAGNVLESNDVSLALGEAGGSVADVGLLSNTLRRSGEGPERPYLGVLAGPSGRVLRGVEFLGTRLEQEGEDGPPA